MFQQYSILKSISHIELNKLNTDLLGMVIVEFDHRSLSIVL